MDCNPTIFFDKNINRYVLYIRANIRLGVRGILYTTSENLVKWDDPKLIKCNPKFDLTEDNFYFPMIFPYPNTNLYIGFPLFFKNNILDKSGQKRIYFNECTKIIISNDRINWDEITEYYFIKVFSNKVILFEWLILYHIHLFALFFTFGITLTIKLFQIDVEFK